VDGHSKWPTNEKQRRETTPFIHIKAYDWLLDFCLYQSNKAFCELNPYSGRPTLTKLLSLIFVFSAMQIQKSVKIYIHFLVFLVQQQTLQTTNLSLRS